VATGLLCYVFFQSAFRVIFLLFPETRIIFFLSFFFFLFYTNRRFRQAHTQKWQHTDDQLQLTQLGSEIINEDMSER